MNTWEVITHIQNIEYENRTLKEELSQLRERKLDAARFYAAAVDVKMVSILHGVNPDTVRKYVELGLIEKHPDSMQAKILIRGSEALLLDFKELRKRYTYRNNPKLRRSC